MPVTLDYALRNTIVEIRYNKLLYWSKNSEQRDVDQVNKFWKSQSHFVMLISAGFQVFCW